MNEVKQSRLDFIDIAKGIGIICVAGGHLVGEGGISFEGSVISVQIWLIKGICYKFDVNFKKLEESKKMNHLCKLQYISKDCSFWAGKSILITGATGLIGRGIIQTLLNWNFAHPNAYIHIIAMVRNKKKAIDYFGSADIQYVIGDIRTVTFENIYADYIIHGASQTSSKEFVAHPIEVSSIALDGTRHILEYAVKVRAKGFIYLSSMEIYGCPKTDEKITEEYPSNIDTMKARSCYPESKRMCENLCISYMAEYHLPVAVLRLAQTFGEGVEYTDNRIFAEFARCVIENRDIILKTKGKTKRSYLYLYDAISAIFLIIYKNGYGESYNIANEDTYCSIYDMAHVVAGEIAENQIDVKIEEKNIEKLGFAPELHMNLDTSKIKKLGWEPTTNLEQMYRIMINFMKTKEENSSFL